MRGELVFWRGTWGKNIQGGEERTDWGSRFELKEYPTIKVERLFLQRQQKNSKHRGDKGKIEYLNKCCVILLGKTQNNICLTDFKYNLPYKDAFFFFPLTSSREKMSYNFDKNVMISP